ncbi:hypothetical protein COCOBI_pt-0200 (chloroplast) [Coccomyxa sp. Obi]|nr:hypothetical protein COCOBI_pt-0200 [Coccomyxa sp. Obi]
MRPVRPCEANEGASADCLPAPETGAEHLYKMLQLQAVS